MNLQAASLGSRGLMLRNVQRYHLPAYYTHGALNIKNWQSSPCQRKPFLPAVAALQFRSVQSSLTLWDADPLKPSSKVEESVLAIKEDLKKDKASTQLQPASATAVKPSLGKRIMDELRHYYHGFRLLFIDVKISWNYLMRVLRGES